MLGKSTVWGIDRERTWGFNCQLRGQSQTIDDAETQDEKKRPRPTPITPFWLLREPSGTLWILSFPFLHRSVSTRASPLPPVGAEELPAGRQLPLSPTPRLCATCRRRQYALLQTGVWGWGVATQIVPSVDDIRAQDDRYIGNGYSRVLLIQAHLGAGLECLDPTMTGKVQFKKHPPFPSRLSGF